MRRGCLPCALALLAAGAAVQPTSAQAQRQAFAPFSWADIDFGPGCAPNPAFERLLTLVMPGSRLDAADPAIDEPLYDAVSGAALHVLQLRSEIPWHGLRLVGVRAYQGIESGPSNFSLLFADSPERVREVWNARGWDLPPVGETRLLEDQAIFTAVGINFDGQHAAVTCFVD